MSSANCTLVAGLCSLNDALSLEPASAKQTGLLVQDGAQCTVNALTNQDGVVGAEGSMSPGGYP